jgi:predicted nuclease of predicted toxin-antitoxin system
MQIKVDEDLLKLVINLLRDKGYQADNVVEEGMSGWKDGVLWKKIQSEGRFLITADKGFADIRHYPPGSHSGIILLRPDQDGIRPIIELIIKVLQNYDLNSLVSCTTVVTPRGVRVRRSV